MGKGTASDLLLYRIREKASTVSYSYVEKRVIERASGAAGMRQEAFLEIQNKASVPNSHKKGRKKNREAVS